MYYYLGLLAVIILFRLLSLPIKNPVLQRRLFFVGAAFAVIVFQSLRSFDVGTDLQSYIPGFLEIGKSDSFTYANYEFVYVLLNKFLYLLGFSQRGYLVVVTLLIQVPIFYTLYKHADRPLLSVLLYFSFGNFLMTFSGLRQSVAMGICFLAYTHIKNRHPWRFAIIILVASLFHTSALLCLVLYPLYHFRLDANKMPFALVAVLVVFLTRKQLLLLGSQLYYGSPTTLADTGAYTMLLVYLFLFVISYLVSTPDKDFEGLRNILLLLIFINCFASVHYYVVRVGFPMTLSLSILIPKLIERFHPKPRWLFYAPCYALCIFAFFFFLGQMNTLPFSFLSELQHP